MNEKYYKYLDTLRDTGIVNMFGARSWLMNAFPELSKKEALQVLQEWMGSFEELLPQEEENETT